MSTDQIAYPDIDAVLGDRAGRFFGEGYKRIQHEIFDITVEARAQGPKLSAVAGVRYPLDWSQKSTRVLTPHLSSIDCSIFGFRLLAVILRECGVSDADIGRCWMPYVQFSSGTVATENLDRFPIEATVTGSTETTLTISGSFGSTMELEAVVALPTPPRLPAPGPARPVAEPAGGYSRGPVYRRGQYLRDIRLDSDGTGASAQFALAPVDSDSVGTGVADSYQPSITLVDATVILAQLSQVVLYELDNIARKDSETLWMRRMTARADAPPPPYTPGSATTRMARSMVLGFGGGKWRISNWEAEFAGCSIRYDLAHQLPA
ncbi:AvrD family protein [Nocardia spumae]|uniref:AvrD family protein n=1 Tax=Nocardia spumae TaxID=2887190 RepID=UPI001D13CF72|nr:AvrD family protein [Nocardia spumae]